MIALYTPSFFFTHEDGPVAIHSPDPSSHSTITSYLLPIYLSFFLQY